MQAAPGNASGAAEDMPRAHEGAGASKETPIVSHKTLACGEPVNVGIPVVALLERFVGFVMKLSMAISAVGVLICLGLISYSVLMRYVFHSPPTWVDDTVGFILAAIVMFAAAPTLRQGGHISVDMLIGLVGAQGKRRAALWSTLSSLLVSAILVVNGWDTVVASKMFGITTTGNVEIPVYLLQILVPVGGASMLLVALEALVRQWAGAPSLDTHSHLPEDAQ